MGLGKIIVGKKVVRVESAMGRIALHLDNSDVVTFGVEHGFEEYSGAVTWERWTLEAWEDFKRAPKVQAKRVEVKKIELADMFDRMEGKG